MPLTVRPASVADIPAIAAAFEDGRRALAQMNVPQWQGEYPNELDAADDIKRGISYVACDGDGTVLGVLAYTLDGEATYDEIDGTWLTKSASSSPTYATIHRCSVAANAARQGVMSTLIHAVEDMARAAGAKSIRIDTHPSNARMHGLAIKLGFTRCGTITLPYEDEIDPARFVYEKVIA